MNGDPHEAIILAMCRAHDREEAAQMGEPSPWDLDNPEDEAEFVADRTAAMREAFNIALAALLPNGIVPAPTEPTQEMLTAGVEAIHTFAVSAERSFERYHGPWNEAAMHVYAERLAVGYRAALSVAFSSSATAGTGSSHG